MIQPQERSAKEFLYDKKVEEGLGKIKEGEIVSAVKMFKEITATYPEKSEAHFYLANLYTILDEKEKAVESFTKAWECKKELLNYQKRIPYKTIFVLLSMETIPKDRLEIWIKRAKRFYKEYPTNERMIIDFAKRINNRKEE
jgi:tetratricopeptide (TPR) repeat protein